MCLPRTDLSRLLCQTGKVQRVLTELLAHTHSASGAAPESATIPLRSCSTDLRYLLVVLRHVHAEVGGSRLARTIDFLAEARASRGRVDESVKRSGELDIGARVCRS